MITILRTTVGLLLVGAVSVSAGYAPPHPLFTDYENVHQMRKRLNITFGYDPIYISHEHCKYLTEAECQEEDELRNSTRGKRRLNPSTGVMRGLVILGYWPEDAAIVGTLPAAAYFEELFNGVGTSDINPAGSISEWLRYNGLTEYDVTWDVQQVWRPIDLSEAEYAGGKSGQRSSAVMKGIPSSILQVMDDEGFDFGPYDSDGDGNLDAIVSIHSGYDANYGSDDCATPTADRIWAQATNAIGNPWISSAGFNLQGYTIAGAWAQNGFCDKIPSPMAIHAHELIHTLSNGVPDLYDASGDASVFIAGVGSFDVMVSQTQPQPQSHSQLHLEV
jgi:M6 family metalloprotease-like protein